MTSAQVVEISVTNNISLDNFIILLFYLFAWQSVNVALRNWLATVTENHFMGLHVIGKVYKILKERKLSGFLISLVTGSTVETHGYCS